ncbi:MAG: hypothetical protein MI861_28435, partial [Pirellulales bacterium]|nr:hypothetical protein [Pirellulales bacterium]
ARINTTSPAMFEGVDALSFARVRDAALDCNYGGDCYGYGLVASGHVDLTIETGMQPYDFMALAPVVNGAGGVISDWEGAPLTITSNGSVLAAGDARVHEEALRLIAEETD